MFTDLLPSFCYASTDSLICPLSIKRALDCKYFCKKKAKSKNQGEKRGISH